MYEDAETAKKNITNYILTTTDRIDIQRDKIAEMLKIFTKPMLAKTLFDIFIRPLKNAVSGAHQARMIDYYTLAMYFYVENDFDYVNVFMGMEGSGKSTLAMLFGMNLKRLGKKFEVDSILYAKDEFKDVINTIKSSENEFIMFDEGRKFFDLRASMYSQRLEILEAFTTERWRRNIYGICISDVSELDKYFRERRARTVFVIPDRQLFFALQNKSVFGMGEDRFNLEYLNMLITQSSFVNYENNASMLMGLPTCHGFGTFQRFDYESELWKKYFNKKKAVSMMRRTDLKHSTLSSEYNSLKEFIGSSGRPHRAHIAQD